MNGYEWGYKGYERQLANRAGAPPVQNDLESIPLALLVFLGGVFAGGNKELFVVCLAIYTLARCFHTYAYANMLQPHRAWCWRTGVLMIVASGVNSIVGVFN
jgi:glutathione S-transferase